MGLPTRRSSQMVAGPGHHDRGVDRPRDHRRKSRLVHPAPPRAVDRRAGVARAARSRLLSDSWRVPSPRPRRWGGQVSTSRAPEDQPPSTLAVRGRRGSSRRDDFMGPHRPTGDVRDKRSMSMSHTPVACRDPSFGNTQCRTGPWPAPPGPPVFPRNRPKRRGMRPTRASCVPHPCTARTRGIAKIFTGKISCGRRSEGLADSR